jgi:BirA family biotin operon repressor/biotin-[acetyl-CoA-carboxylase] ligase
MGLYVSVILRPKVSPEWASRTTLVAGVALAMAIDQLGLRPSLKWPNDILIGRRKAAGILTEATFQKNHLASVIVGVGVNVNTRMEDFPNAIRGGATSLRLSVGCPIPRATLLQGFLYQLEVWYELFCQGSFERILDTWRHYESILGSLVEVSVPGSRLLGVAEDIDSCGRLLVRDTEGVLHQVTVGDVAHCRVQDTTEGGAFE